MHNLLTPTIPNNNVEQFWSKIEKTDSCWNWKGGRSSNGYGYFKYNNKTISAHRLSYQMFRSIIPEGLQIDHLCRNRACVNPEHLEVVTCRENLLRGNTFQAKNSKKTHCKRGHLFSKENTYIDSQCRRECRTCRREVWNRA